MAIIGGGTFWQGSLDVERASDEYPRLRVQLGPYCMDLTEVTVARYRQCSQAGSCRAAPTTVNLPGVSATLVQIEDWSRGCNGDRSDRDRHPINCVDWSDASAFCHWAGGRLPTEAEWEFAARGPDGRRYPWGDAAPTCDLLNLTGDADGWANTSPVGSYPRGVSPYGLFDMAGNVSEWTADWYGSGSYSGYVTSPVFEPTGPTIGEYRICRGGAWNGDAGRVRAASRNRNMVAIRNSDLGFRCVRGVP